MKILKENLQSGYMLFGNKGACWGDTVHIYNSEHGGNLCGNPALSTNWARIWEHDGAACPDCVAKYNEIESAKA